MDKDEQNSTGDSKRGDTDQDSVDDTGESCDGTKKGDTQMLNEAGCTNDQGKSKEYIQNEESKKLWVVLDSSYEDFLRMPFICDTAEEESMPEVLQKTKPQFQIFLKHIDNLAKRIEMAMEDNCEFPFEKCYEILGVVSVHCLQLHLYSIIMEIHAFQNCAEDIQKNMKEIKNRIRYILEKDKKEVCDKGTPLLLLHEVWDEIAKGMHCYSADIWFNLYQEIRHPEGKGLLSQPTDCSDNTDQTDLDTGSLSQQSLQRLEDAHTAFPGVPYEIWRRQFSQNIIGDVRIKFEEIVVGQNSRYNITSDEAILRTMMGEFCHKFLELCDTVRHLSVQAMGAWQAQGSEFPLEECRQLLLEVSEECLDISNKGVLNSFGQPLQIAPQENIDMNLRRLQELYEEKRGYLLGRLDRASDAFDYGMVIQTGDVDPNNLGDFISIRSSQEYHPHRADTSSATEFAG